MVIKHVPHHQINKKAWDETIQQSQGCSMYATTFWLDNFSPNWDALIVGNYEFVMPLTHKKKWGINYVAQPHFTQQLGVFSKQEITNNILQQFIAEAKKKYRFGEIFVQEIAGVEIASSHKNYILHLAKNYAEIKKNYSNDLLKKNLQRTQKFGLKYVASSHIENAVETFEKMYASRTPHVTYKEYKKLAEVAKKLQENGEAFVREVRLPTNNNLLACGLFLTDGKRIYNIASSTLPDGRTLEANHFLFDELIQEFSGKDLILDFEGSDLPGIERFYKKFGAELETYSQIKWNDLPAPWKWVKK